MLEDTSGGIHDTLLAACDRYRYEQLGCAEYHDNCTDNLAQGLAELGLTPPDTPSPLNLFMNIPWMPDGSLSLEPPKSTPNCYIRLRADMDLIIAFCACSMDLLPINGPAGKPTEGIFGSRRRERPTFPALPWASRSAQSLSRPGTTGPVRWNHAICSLTEL